VNQLNLDTWTQGLLGELIVVERGSSPRPIVNYVTNSDDGVNWVKIGDTKEGQKYVKKTKEKITKEGALKSRYVAKGDFILSNSMSFGRPYIMDIEGYIHDGWFALRLPKQINTDFFYYLLSSTYIKDQINLLAVGGVVKNISGDLVKKVSLPLPPSAEQKVIADKLDTLLAQVETTKARLDRIPQILKTFRQSVLASAVSGKLTEEWRAENPFLLPVNLEDIAKYWADKYKAEGKKAPKAIPPELMAHENLPENWVNTKIGCVFDVNVGATPSRGIAEYWNGKLPWVSSSEVAFCRISSTKETITGLGLKKTSTNLHPIGTVMLAMIGQGKTRGQVAILDIEACHNQNTAALRVPNGFAISEFLYFYLTKQYEETRSVGGGNNQKALNKSFVQALEFPLPPLEEQNEIGRRVEQLFAHADKIEQQVKAAQQRVDKLTQSILAEAFRGELTTQWRKDNPDLISGDNSAEALLEKIKAERDNLSKKPRKKK
jgi:type I restriction enzyme S subunit